MKYKNTLPFLFACLLLLSGCGSQSYEKTIVLPSVGQQNTSSVTPDNQEWGVKKIYQHEYAPVDNYDSSFSEQAPSFSTVGWADIPSDTLYTVQKDSSDALVFQKMDIRYGFHEDYGRLEQLSYIQMKLSPDGKYLLYNQISDDSDGNVLMLYSILDNTTSEIFRYPDPEPLFRLEFSWSDDSRSILYWMTTSNTEVFYKEININSEAAEAYTPYYKNQFLSLNEKNPLTTVYRYQLSENESQEIVNLSKYIDYLDYDTSDVVIDKNMYDKIVFFNSDASIVATASYGCNIFMLTYPETGNTYSQELHLIVDKIDYSSFSNNFCGFNDKYFYGLNFSNNDIKSGIPPTLISLNISDFTSSSVSAAAEIPDLVSSLARPAETLLDTRGTLEYQVTDDNSHLITLESSDVYASCIYSYQLTHTGEEILLSDKTLLYQSPQPLDGFRILPDSRHILLQSTFTDTDYRTKLTILEL